ncbi:MAG TPA: phytanoyl-CoA dioxygenase family protein, partial [Enteractinococcus sp.]
MTTTQDSTIQDLYPTRSVKETRVFDRQGPVVHGSAEDGPMDAELLKQFDEKGYLHIEQIITKEELAELQAELKRLAANADVKADERTVVEAKSNEVRSIFEVHKTNEIIKKIANDPRLVRRAEQIL